MPRIHAPRYPLYEWLLDEENFNLIKNGSRKTYIGMPGKHNLGYKIIRVYKIYGGYAVKVVGPNKAIAHFNVYKGHTEFNYASQNSYSRVVAKICT